MNNTWLVFSFSVPTKNQAGRVKILRRLTALGSLQVKNSLYLLPSGDQRHEALNWLVKEVESIGGEAVFLACDSFENMDNAQLALLFAKERDREYAVIAHELRTMLDLWSDRSQDGKVFKERSAALRKVVRHFEALKSIDYFPSGMADTVRSLLTAAESAITDRSPQPPGVMRLSVADFQGKTWVTRKRPFIDRLASIWLIRRYVDQTATFVFTDGPGAPGDLPAAIGFDMVDAQFTHVGDLTTFEVLRLAFGLEGAITARFANVIRSIDLPGMEHAPAETSGVKLVLQGMCDLELDDHRLAIKACELFDALHQTYTIKGEYQ